MSRLATGVTVLTTLGADRHEVMTANAVTSVSLEPTLLLVSVAAESRWLAAARGCGVFAVNVLGAHHEQVARWCADRARHQRPDVIVEHGTRVSETTGVLLLDESLAGVECRIYAEHEAGDHVLLLGEVLSLHVPETVDGPAPLVFFDRRYAALEPEPAPAPALSRVRGCDPRSDVYPPDREVPAVAASG